MSNQHSWYRDGAADSAVWQPVIFDYVQPGDAEQIANLSATARVWQVHDTIEQQLRDLIKARMPETGSQLSSGEIRARMQEILGTVSLRDYGRWVYYPWSGRLVHLLPPAEFHELRLDRNRYKITPAEEQLLFQFVVGIVGLSVGNAVATTAALEGIGGHFKLADFDDLALSNMNRVRAGVQDLGLPKTVLAARQIFEVNPFAQLTLFHQGVTPDNVDEFLQSDPKLDVLIDECDSMQMKLLLRERARTRRITVIMETSDRGMLDIERFDLEPERPILHGLLGETRSDHLPQKLSDEDKVRLVLPFVGVDSISTRGAASLVEIGRTISTWPQLGSEVILGGASVTTALRRLALGLRLPSGRRFVDLESIIANGSEVEKPSDQPARSQSSLDETIDLDERIPKFIRLVVEHGALAPSGGNCQPWRFSYDGEKLWVIHDKKRSQNLLDFSHRASDLALGAAIENVHIAAASHGHQTSIELFPRPNDNSIVAALTFDEAPPQHLAERARLYHQIRQRVTNRKHGRHLPLAPEEIATLQDAAKMHDCQVQFLTGKVELQQMGRLVGEGDRLRFLTENLRKEMLAELRWTHTEAQKQRDGLELSTLELNPGQTAGLRLMARPGVGELLAQLNLGKRLAEAAMPAIVSSSAVGLLTVNGTAPPKIIAAGRGFERLWLQATGMELALHPMTALIYMFALCDHGERSIFTDEHRDALKILQNEFYELFPAASGATCLMLFRLARASAPTARSLRLPLAQILDFKK